MTAIVMTFQWKREQLEASRQEAIGMLRMKDTKNPDGLSTVGIVFLLTKSYGLVLCIVVECSNAVELYLLEELIGSAHALGGKAACSNLVLLYKSCLNSLGTLL